MTPRRRLILILALLAIGALVVLGLWRGRAPEPPAIHTEGLDPAVAAWINEALREVRAEPRSGPAWGKLGSVLMHYEMPEATTATFLRAEKFSPREPRWPYLHALSLMSEDPEAAVAELEKAVARSGDQTDAPRLRLAQLLAERGRGAEAARHFQQLLRAQPNHAPAALGLARLCFAETRPRDGTNRLAGCLANPHTRKAALALLANLEQMLGNVAAAETAARRSAALPADEPWPDPFWEEAQRYRAGRKAWLEDASALLDQGQPGAAERLLRQVTQRYPDDQEGWYLLGWALNQQGRAPEAEAALREHLRRSAPSAKGDAQLAVSLLAQKRYTEAIAVLEAGAQLKPTWREFQSNLGYAWLQLGQEEQAQRHYRAALALDPGYLPSYTALAELDLRRGEAREARQLLQQAAQLDPDDARVRALRQRLEQP